MVIIKDYYTKVHILIFILFLGLLSVWNDKGHIVF